MSGAPAAEALLWIFSCKCCLCQLSQQLCSQTTKTSLVGFTQSVFYNFLWGGAAVETFTPDKSRSGLQ